MLSEPLDSELGDADRVARTSANETAGGQNAVSYFVFNCP